MSRRTCHEMFWLALFSLAFSNIEQNLTNLNQSHANCGATYPRGVGRLMSTISNRAATSTTKQTSSRTMASSLPSNSSKQQLKRPRSTSNEIATFSRMASASASDSDDNNSVISLDEEIHEDNYDNGEIMMIRRGLVDYCYLRGCGTGSTGASSSSLLEEHGATGINGEERSGLLVVSMTNNNDAKDDDNSMMRQHAQRQRCQLIMSRARSNPTLFLTATILIGIGIFTIYFFTSDQFFHNINLHRTGIYIRSKTHQFSTKKSATKQKSNNVTFRVHPRPTLDEIFQYPPFPAKALLGMTVNSTAVEDANIDPPYNPSDFYYENEVGKNRTLTYWEEVVAAIEEFQENYTSNEVDDGLVQNEEDEEHSSIVTTTPWRNITTWGPCFPRIQPVNNDKQVRSLLRKKTKSKSLVYKNWTYIVQNNDIDTNDETSIHYPTYRKSYSSSKEEYLGGLCRPGFLIIGQGKCGTSSLYKYLTGHDRVMPAVQKQIHYFIFNTNKVSSCNLH